MLNKTIRFYIRIRNIGIVRSYSELKMFLLHTDLDAGIELQIVFTYDYFYHYKLGDLSFFRIDLLP